MGASRGGPFRRLLRTRMYTTRTITTDPTGALNYRVLPSVLLSRIHLPPPPHRSPLINIVLHHKHNPQPPSTSHAYYKTTTHQHHHQLHLTTRLIRTPCLRAPLKTFPTPASRKPPSHSPDPIISPTFYVPTGHHSLQRTSHYPHDTHHLQQPRAAPNPQQLSTLTTLQPYNPDSNLLTISQPASPLHAHAPPPLMTSVQPPTTARKALATCTHHPHRPRRRVTPSPDRAIQLAVPRPHILSPSSHQQSITHSAIQWSVGRGVDPARLMTEAGAASGAAFYKLTPCLYPRHPPSPPVGLRHRQPTLGIRNIRLIPLQLTTTRLYLLLISPTAALIATTPALSYGYPLTPSSHKSLAPPPTCFTHLPNQYCTPTSCLRSFDHSDCTSVYRLTNLDSSLTPHHQPSLGQTNPLASRAPDFPLAYPPLARNFDGRVVDGGAGRKDVAACRSLDLDVPPHALPCAQRALGPPRPSHRPPASAPVEHPLGLASTLASYLPVAHAHHESHTHSTGASDSFAQAAALIAAYAHSLLSVSLNCSLNPLPSHLSVPHPQFGGRFLSAQTHPLQTILNRTPQASASPSTPYGGIQPDTTTICYTPRSI
ncbi:hypothetical protein C7M84_013922 [Penaeus vannamei]|uniref:Uncharacterized protein n=1 Tax=Penaeus vannamei TaxID=6689 RepID=A0A3R7QHV6_PENVA|nr:hypothetical protein C7M84_013922 [Penaeus vannamei]